MKYIAFWEQGFNIHKCFFSLMAIKDVGSGGFAAGLGSLHCLIFLFVWIDVFPNGFAAGPGSFRCLMLWIVSMVWPCVLRVMCGSVMWPLGRGKAMRGY